MRHITPEGPAVPSPAVHSYATRFRWRTARQPPTFDAPLKLPARLRPTAVAGLTVVVLTALVAAIFHRLTFRGLSPEAMDMAQLSRNIANGRGFATDFVRPLTLPLAGRHAFIPDLVHEPLYPLILALAMAVLGARDAVVWGLPLVLYVLTALLLFTFVWRLTSSVVAAQSTTAIFALSVPVLVAANTCNPVILSACLLLALLLVLTPNPPETAEAPEPAEEPETAEGPDEPQPAEELDLAAAVTAGPPRAAPSLPRRFLVAGVLAGLCFLTDYVSVVYVMPLAIVWGARDGRWNRRTVAAFGLGFLFVALPWWIRNDRLTGNPLYTLQWLDLSMQSARYPGLTLLRNFYEGRRLSVPFLAPDLGSLAYRIGSNAATYFETVPRFPHPYLMPFVVMGYWLPATAMLTERTRKGILYGVLLYIPVLCVLGRQGAAFLVPLAGLLAYIAAVTCLQLCESWMVHWLESYHLSHRYQIKDELAPAWRIFKIEANFAAVVGLLLVLPLLWYTLNAHSAPTAPDYAAMASFGASLPERRFVVTDVPWTVAWYARRPAIWLPTDTDQLAAIEDVRPVSTVYLSPALLDYPARENVTLWQGIYRQDRDIDGFDVVSQPGARDVIYRRVPTIAEAQQALAARPADPVARVALGRAQLAAGQPAAALATLLAAQAQAGPTKSLATYQGLALAYLRLKQPSAAVHACSRALKLAPRDQRTRLITARAFTALGRRDRALGMYERVLSDEPEQAEALNNSAYLYAHDHQQPYRALEMARRALTADPDSAAKWDTLGWATYGVGRAAEAVPILQHAAKLAPESDLIQYHLAKVLLATGHRQAALRALSTALKHALPAKEYRDASALLRD